MKKIIASVLVCTLCLCCLSSCSLPDLSSLPVVGKFFGPGKGEITEHTIAPEQTEEPSSSAEETTAAKRKQELIVAMNCTFPPYEYYDGEVPAGFDVELAQLLADKLDRELVIKNTAFSSLFSLLEAGDADYVISAVDENDADSAHVYLTDPYYTDVQMLLIKKQTTAKTKRIESDEDLLDKSIGVMEGSASELYAATYFPSENLRFFNSYMDLLAALVNGTVAGAVMQKEAFLRNSSFVPDVIVLDGTFCVNNFRIAARTQKLADEANSLIRSLNKTGMMNELLAPYLFPGEEFD